MKVIITRNTRVDGMSVKADDKNAVEVSKSGGNVLIAAGKAIPAPKPKPTAEKPGK